MPDWKEMYLHLFRETQKAVIILMEAQLKCENMYINAQEPEILLMPKQDLVEPDKKSKKNSQT